jgi:hypothetical protein
MNFRIRFQEQEEILFNYKDELPVIKKASEAGLCGRILGRYILRTMITVRDKFKFKFKIY